jgi:hypothetical protein
VVLLAVAAAVVVLAAGAGGEESSPLRGTAAFAWLRPAPPPIGWSVARLMTGPMLPYPPGWRPIKTDAGTASAAVVGPGGRIDAYLNVTPKQAAETAANWSSFRPQHNRREGDRAVRVIAAARNLTFRSGRGSCVIDEYSTSTASYREIACLVTRTGSSAVVVAAARTSLWDREVATLERAVSSFVP